MWVPPRQVFLTVGALRISYYAPHWMAGVPGASQKNCAYWTSAELLPGQHDISELEKLPGVIPFAIYAQAPLRLISWCSFELPCTARQLLRRLANMCENRATKTRSLVHIVAQQEPQVNATEGATQYLATLTTINIANRGRMPSYTNFVQNFIVCPLPPHIYLHPRPLLANAQPL